MADITISSNIMASIAIHMMSSQIERALIIILIPYFTTPLANSQAVLLSEIIYPAMSYLVP